MTISKELLEYAKNHSEPVTIQSGVPYVVIPKDYEAVGLERFLNEPKSIAVAEHFADKESFVEYYKVFKNPATKVFALLYEDGGFISSHFNYHQPGKPSWNRHKGSLVLNLDSSFKAWSENAKTHFSQLEFAEFLQSRKADLSEHSDADLLEIIQSLKVTSSQSFSNKVSLSGKNFSFSLNDDTKISANKSSVKLPEAFSLSIPIFENDEKRSVEVFIRYRFSKEGKISLFYQVFELDKIIKKRFRELVSTVSEEIDSKIFIMDSTS
jgi:uncharacterized protein YfdQ (DUF2303 family)